MLKDKFRIFKNKYSGPDVERIISGILSDIGIGAVGAEGT